MRTRTILAQFSGLRAFDGHSVFGGRMDKWWKMLVEGKGPRPLVTVRMNLIDSQVGCAKRRNVQLFCIGSAFLNHTDLNGNGR